MHIENQLYQKKLQEPLLNQKSVKKSQEEWELLKRKAPWVIHLILVRNVTFNIIKEKMVVDLMKPLSNMYEKSSTLNKVFLMSFV